MKYSTPARMLIKTLVTFSTQVPRQSNVTPAKNLRRNIQNHVPKKPQNIYTDAGFSQFGTEIPRCLEASTGKPMGPIQNGGEISPNPHGTYG